MFNAAQPESPLCKPKEKYWLAFVLAFLAACALFVPYIIQDQGYFLFYGDFNVQQVPFYKLAHRAVREGNLFWNFKTDLGANFIGSYSFYLLGSPFFWLTLPFNTDFVPHLMGPLLILKFSFASLTAYAYITRFVRNKNYALIGALLYAFSGFSVYNIFFNHFHEAIVYFPLLLLSLEWLMMERRRLPYILMVALCAVSNYYFFFGMVVFTVIYVVLRAMSGEWDLFGSKSHLGRDFRRLGSLALCSVLGLMLSAFMLLPAVLAITSNTRIGSYLTGWSGLVYSRSQIYSYILQCFFFPPDLPARPVFFPDADVKWSSVAGWLPVFSMVGVIAYLTCKPKTWQKRLIVVAGIMAFIPVLNSIYSAFNYSYYARWFYMPLLIMALMTAQGMEDPAVDWRRGWRWTAGITMAFTVAIALYPQGQYSDGTFSGFGLYTDGYYDRFLVTCGIAVVCLLLTALLIVLKSRWPRDFAPVALVLVLVVSVVYSSYFVGMGKTSSYNTTDYIIPHLLEPTETITLRDEDDTIKPINEIEDFRVDVYEGMDNVAMFMDVGSINAFHSIVPGSVMEFYKYVGVERTVATRPSTEYYALRGLLSVKYLLDYADDTNHFEDDDGFTRMNGWTLYTGSDELVVDKDDHRQNDYYIYENDFFVPYGFTYDYYMTEETCDAFSGADRVDIMMKAMLLNEEQIKKYGHMMQDLAADGEEYTGKITYPFYYNNCRDRAASACSSFTTDIHGFTAVTTLPKDNLVFFSIPYEEGWSATVDGQPVPIEKVNVGFMAVPVPGGDEAHTIRFTYHTPGLATGIKVSLAAAALTLVYVALCAVWRRRHGPEAVCLPQPQPPAPAADEADDLVIEDGFVLTDVAPADTPDEPEQPDILGDEDFNILTFEEPDPDPAAPDAVPEQEE